MRFYKISKPLIGIMAFMLVLYVAMIAHYWLIIKKLAFNDDYFYLISTIETKMKVLVFGLLVIVTLKLIVVSTLTYFLSSSNYRKSLKFV